MTVSVLQPAACPTCAGTGEMPLVMAPQLAGALKQLPMYSSPCIVCRCWCGQPSISVGGMCQGHEDDITEAS